VPRILKSISLDEVPDLRGKKRADYLLLLEGGVLVVLEETSKPRLEDLDEKLPMTIEWLRRRGPANVGISPHEIRGIVAVCHFRRGIGGFSKYAIPLASRFKRDYGVPLLLCKCRRWSDLLGKLRL